MKMSLKSLLGAAAMAGCVASGASAATVGFENIPGRNTVGDFLADQFSLNIESFSPTQVLVQLVSAVNAGKNYFISGVFVADTGDVLGGELTAFSAENSSPGNLFNYNLKNFPQSNAIGFTETAAYIRQTGGGSCTANTCGIQPGEIVGFLFDGSVANVLAALGDGSLSFGLQVKSIALSASDSYVTPSHVPVPAAGVLLLAALGAFGLFRSRRV